MLRRGLTEEGYLVTSVPDGEQGLALLLAGGVDVCVLDVQLPGIDGFGVLTEARKSNIETPILLLTARDSVPDRVHGLQLGADDYLTKPFAFAELVARLRARTRRTGPVAETLLRCGLVELDTIAHRATVSGEPVALSAKQFALLEFFLRHRGHVVTREMILQRVFGYPFDPGTNLVDVHVANLRQRLGLAAAAMIVAVRGVGYRVSDETP
jgi:DNA-binding response OmpR family regulator